LDRKALGILLPVALAVAQNNGIPVSRNGKPWSSAMAYAYLVPLAGGDPIPLVKEAIVIGRRPECDIRLEIPNVSGRHAELRLHRGHWHVIDLGSANGTKVNGDKVKKKRLSPGDEVIFARTNRFKIEFDPETAANIARPKSDSDKGRERPMTWDKAGIRGNRPAEKVHVPLDGSSDDFDILDEEIEKESGFQKSLLEKAGLEKGPKAIIDDDLDADLEELEELEGMIDDPSPKPKKRDG
jgi:pSer/pThr/pTyr-binding forkhead associated (FHA) protein